MTGNLPGPDDDDEDFGEHDYDNEQINELVREMRAALYAGRFPRFGRAVCIHDTIESLHALHGSHGAEARAAAQFDLVLALVGWIPGTGGAVRDTFRAIRDWGYKGPQLFDSLRNICYPLGIYTSPELLLEQLFSEAGLQAILATAQISLRKSWAHDNMSAEAQCQLMSTLIIARATLPAMLAVVKAQLDHYAAMQPNSAGRKEWYIDGPDHADLKPGIAPQPSMPAQGHDDEVGTLVMGTQANNADNFIEINHHWPDLTPMAGAPYRVVFSDGTRAEGTLDSKGFVRLENTPSGPAQVYVGEDPRSYARPALDDIGAVEFSAIYDDLVELGHEIDAGDIEYLLGLVAGRRND